MVQHQAHVLAEGKVNVLVDVGLDDLEVLLLRAALLAAGGEGGTLLAGDGIDLELGEVHRALGHELVVLRGGGGELDAVQKTGHCGAGGGERRDARGHGGERLATTHDGRGDVTLTFLGARDDGAGSLGDALGDDAPERRGDLRADGGSGGSHDERRGVHAGGRARSV